MIQTALKPSELLGLETVLLDQLPDAILCIENEKKTICYANIRAQSIFKKSKTQLIGATLAEQFPFASPILDLVDRLSDTQMSINEVGVQIEIPPFKDLVSADIHAKKLVDFGDYILLAIRPQNMTDLLSRQIAAEGAAKAVDGMSSLLAHEIKNPLSGIRGAAQLLEESASDDDRPLTTLICEETDRIVALVNRMEVFGENGPFIAQDINIHAVLHHVKQLAEAGFAKHITISERYDPSLPPVSGHKDRLIQLYLNLLKNAAEALKDKKEKGHIQIVTAYRSGLKMSQTHASKSSHLPLEIKIVDNGNGVPSEIEEHMFDPFISSKQGGSGFGLSLVAKIIQEHGGIIAHERINDETIFKTLLPMYKAPPPDK